MAAGSRIAIFGGTFDPVHLGHIAMAEAAQKALKLDWVHYLPCQVSPHKLESSPTSAEHRLEMLELATSHQPWAVVNDFETQREGPSYSWMTAQTMKAHFPDSRLFWIMGSDQWHALDRWQHPERLAACVEFVVFHRGDEPEPREGYTLHPLPAIHPANATEIRQQLASGEKDHPWLNAKVAAFIEQQKLYTTS